VVSHRVGSSRTKDRGTKVSGQGIRGCTLYEKEIERGAAILDHEHPGWELLIDTSTLQLSSSHSCVLGQVWGNFWNAVGDIAEFDRGNVKPEDCGFLIPFFCSDDHRKHGYDDSCCWSQLTEDWITFVKQRLNEGVNIGPQLLASEVS
jgi:hypothetical protein